MTSDHRPVSFDIKTWQHQETDEDTPRQYYKNIKSTLFKRILTRKITLNRHITDVQTLENKITKLTNTIQVTTE